MPRSEALDVFDALADSVGAPTSAPSDGAGSAISNAGGGTECVTETPMAMETSFISGPPGQPIDGTASMDEVAGFGVVATDTIFGGTLPIESPLVDDVTSIEAPLTGNTGPMGATAVDGTMAGTIPIAPTPMSGA